MKRRHSIESALENFTDTAKRQRTSTSLLTLNDYCLLEIYKYLQLDDFINLSRTCKRLKDVAILFNKIYTEFKINVNFDNKGDDYVEHIISNLNTEVTEVSIDYRQSNIPMNVRKMSECCNVHVKSLRIANWTVHVTESVNHGFDHLEALTMINCDFRSDLYCFLELFKGLKVVNLCRFQNMSNTFLEKLFRRNPTIESFVWMGDVEAFDEFGLFDIVPKLAALSLRVDEKINEFRFGTAFRNLTKLQLFCNGKDISKFLHSFGKSTAIPMLKELELLRVRVDDSFIDALCNFHRLELLVISTWTYWELKSPTVWPGKLRDLRLDRFIMTMDGLMSTIRQLEYLEDIDIAQCYYDEHFFESFDKLTHAITSALANNGDNNEKKLNILISHKFTPKIDVIETNRFRILNKYYMFRKNHLGIDISFPGIDKSVL